MTHGGKREGAGRKAGPQPKNAVLSIKTNRDRLQSYREAALRSGITLTELVETACDFWVLEKIDKDS